MSTSAEHDAGEQARHGGGTEDRELAPAQSGSIANGARMISEPP